MPAGRPPLSKPLKRLHGSRKPKDEVEEPQPRGLLDAPPGSMLNRSRRGTPSSTLHPPGCWDRPMAPPSPPWRSPWSPTSGHAYVWLWKARWCPHRAAAGCGIRGCRLPTSRLGKFCASASNLAYRHIRVPCWPQGVVSRRPVKAAARAPDRNWPDTSMLSPTSWRTEAPATANTVLGCR
jgi:hypothetical protein